LGKVDMERHKWKIQIILQYAIGTLYGTLDHLINNRVLATKIGWQSPGTGFDQIPLLGSEIENALPARERNPIHLRFQFVLPYDMVRNTMGPFHNPPG